jgi:hypothetical protein
VQSDEDPALFWAFADGWAAAPGAAAPDGPQCWAAITDAAAAHLSPSVTKMLHVSLGLRQYSPRLEAFRQLAPPPPQGAHCCWVDIGGQAVTDAPEVEGILRASLANKEDGDASPVAAQPGLYPFDHLYSAANLNLSDPSLLPAVLYAPLGAACAAPLDAALRAAAAHHPRLAYAWRPMLSGAACAGHASRCGSLGAEGPLVVSGYGVVMAMKNTEYNARDEPADGARRGGGAAAAAGGAGGRPGDLAGFDVQALLQQQQRHGAPPDNFTRELGLQAAQRIAAAADPLRALVEVSQNLPLLAGALSRAAVGPGLREAVEGLGLPPGVNLMLVNGVVADVDGFDLHDFAVVLRREARLADALAAAGLSHGAARRAMRLRAGGNGDGGSTEEQPWSAGPRESFSARQIRLVRERGAGQEGATAGRARAAQFAGPELQAVLVLLDEGDSAAAAAVSSALAAAQPDEVHALHGLAWRPL